MQLLFPIVPREFLTLPGEPYAFTAAGDLYPVRVTLARVHSTRLFVRSHAGLSVPHQWAWSREEAAFLPYGWRVPVPDPFLCLVSVLGAPARD